MYFRLKTLPRTSTKIDYGDSTGELYHVKLTVPQTQVSTLDNFQKIQDYLNFYFDTFLNICERGIL